MEVFFAAAGIGIAALFVFGVPRHVRAFAKGGEAQAAASDDAHAFQSELMRRAGALTEPKGPSDG